MPLQNIHRKECNVNDDSAAIKSLHANQQMIHTNQKITKIKAAFDTLIRK